MNHDQRKNERDHSLWVGEYEVAVNAAGSSLAAW